MYIFGNVHVPEPMTYQHFYTGAIMSQEYPAVFTYKYEKWIIWMVHFGGVPSNTYTTMKLHSSPKLVRNLGLRMDV